MGVVPQNVKDYVNGHLDEMAVDNQMKSAKKFYRRWARLSKSDNPDDPNTIDWDNPYVQLEYLLCDSGLLMRLSDPKTQDKAVETEIPPELHDLYFGYAPEFNEDAPKKKYCEIKLTPWMVMKSAPGAVKKVAKDKIVARREIGDTMYWFDTEHPDDPYTVDSSAEALAEWGKEHHCQGAKKWKIRLDKSNYTIYLSDGTGDRYGFISNNPHVAIKRLRKSL